MSMRRTVCALALALATGCGPSAGGPGSIPPGGNDRGVGNNEGPKGPAEDNSMGALQHRLEAFRTKKGSIMNASTRDPAVCEELCSLASDICEVQEKLCDLADDHPGDDQYQNLCREAHNECKEAQRSCVRCVESNR